MLAVADDTRAVARNGHAAWPESFSEMFMHVAGVFANERMRRHGRAYLLGAAVGDGAGDPAGMLGVDGDEVP